MIDETSPVLLELFLGELAIKIMLLVGADVLSLRQMPLQRITKFLDVEQDRAERSP